MIHYFFILGFNLATFKLIIIWTNQIKWYLFSISSRLQSDQFPSRRSVRLLLPLSIVRWCAERNKNFIIIWKLQECIFIRYEKCSSICFISLYNDRDQRKMIPSFNPIDIQVPLSYSKINNNNNNKLHTSISKRIL